MVVDENGDSADEGSLETNCAVFACLNLAFPEASWDETQHAVCVFSDSS